MSDQQAKCIWISDFHETWWTCYYFNHAYFGRMRLYGILALLFSSFLGTLHHLVITFLENVFILEEQGSQLSLFWCETQAFGPNLSEIWPKSLSLVQFGPKACSSLTLFSVKSHTSHSFAIYTSPGLNFLHKLAIQLLNLDIVHCESHMQIS